jgi:hypothetical protein
MKKILIVLFLFIISVTYPQNINYSEYKKWINGPSIDQDYFPIGVWFQNPANAIEYKNIGINTYIGLWQGPTGDQLALLEKAGMKVICDQNSVGLKNRDNPVIIGWLQEDEPDNARQVFGIFPASYGSPVKPQDIIDKYNDIKRNDPSRPVFLNLGMGVAWDGWHGRGKRTNHPEDYPEYIRGCDIVSFDIYPSVSTIREISGNLWYVAKGVERLKKWGGDGRIVWNVIEGSGIDNPHKKPAPGEIRAEVWMSLIHGSKGIIYFVHRFKPRFVEDSLLADSELAKHVASVNSEIQGLARVLNSADITGRVAVTTDDQSVPVASMVKIDGEYLYLFAVCMRNKSVGIRARIQGIPRDGSMEVLGENRQLRHNGGIFNDTFGPWGVHLYRIKL